MACLSGYWSTSTCEPAITLDHGTLRGNRKPRPHQDIAALTLPRDLRELHLAQRSGACSPRLPRVAEREPDFSAGLRLGGVERPGRVVRFARLMHRPGHVVGGSAV